MIKKYKPLAREIEAAMISEANLLQVQNWVNGHKGQDGKWHKDAEKTYKSSYHYDKDIPNGLELYGDEEQQAMIGDFIVKDGNVFEAWDADDFIAKYEEI
jgi:hypothetical protein